MTAPAWLDHAILTWGYWAVLVAVALETMGLPFPGETALLAAAIYAGTGRPLSIVLVIVAASAGAILGDNTGYAIGYFGGYPLARRILGFLRVKESALTYAQGYFARHGAKTVFIGRFFALLRATVAFIAGVSHMPWRRFLVWNALGGIVWATLYGLLGYFLGRNLPLLGVVTRTIGVGGTILLAVAAVALAVFLVIRRRRAEAELAGAPQPTPPTTPRATPHATPAPPTRAAVRLRSGPQARRRASQSRQPHAGAQQAEK